MNRIEARYKVEAELLNAGEHGETVVRIIHGQGKHSEFFPVIKSEVRQWLKESPVAQQNIESVFRGEDGSPYTLPNPGETVVLLKSAAHSNPEPQISMAEEDEREARQNAKGIRADRLRKLRRQNYRR